MSQTTIGGSFSSNASADIYRSGNSPPASPDVAGAACNLIPDFANAHAVATLATTTYRWTHIGLFPLSTDIRDGYSGGGPNAEAAPSSWDTIYVPNKNGTAFAVVFVEHVRLPGGSGTSNDYKRVYLQRQAPTWPTTNL